MENNDDLEGKTLESIDEHMAKLRHMANVAQKQKRIEEAQRAREITTCAFRQKNIALTDEIPAPYLSKLIGTLTEERQGLVDKNTEFINKRIADCLLTLMPREVRKCWKAYPETMLQSPGFYYQASPEYGKSLWMWVQPKMPAFFKQGDEMHILIDKFLYDLITIDKTLVRLTSHKEKLAVKQVEYADKLIKMHDQTYYSLLKEYPLWFEIVYNSIYPEQKLLGND